MNCPKARLPALTVQLWEAGSQIEYFAGSQSLDLNTFASSTGLLEVPFAHLGRSRPETIELEHGGMYDKIVYYALVYILTCGLGLSQILDLHSAF